MRDWLIGRFNFANPDCNSYKVVRGALDFNGVVGRRTARSRYGCVLALSILTLLNFIAV